MPSTHYVDLKRRFRDLQDTELAHLEFDDPRVLVSLEEWERDLTVGWTELLEHPRIVMLAEAGAGKSKEMSEQAKRLAKEGRYAFFVPLESLDREPLKNLLEPSDEANFEAWKTDGHKPGWFFLDAVDELKLINSKLDRALLQFSKDIAGHLDRARVLVSCRPSDWRPDQDLTKIQERLRFPGKISEIVGAKPEEVFMAAFGTAPAKPVHFHHQQPSEPAHSTVRTVAMLPMNDCQIMKYSKHRGVKNVDAFLREIQRENAWAFARRPLDLADLAANWVESGRLGTQAEQHEANVTTKLRDNHERPDDDKLSDMCARLGAEKLALGLALTRTRTIGSPERSVDASFAERSLHADTILPNWTEAQRQSLLRRALFDPATYGRIRFHHRSVQEYLAAYRLKRLRCKGMSKSALSELFFAKVYGVNVVRPSMRAIAAWLALWNSDMRRELIKREPEVLLSFGDPSKLELEAKIFLLQILVAKYGNGGRRGLKIPIEAIQRIASPDLANVIRECWNKGASNVDIRHLLIKMIWQGRIIPCMDLARNAAFDAACDHHTRITAMKALLACGHQDVVRECASAMLTDFTSWPNEVVLSLVADLFPTIISAEELMILIEARHEDANTSLEFNWVSKQITKTVSPKSESTIILREQMVNLILRTRQDQPEDYKHHSKFGFLAPALAELCERQLSHTAGEPTPNLIYACVVASRFGAEETDPDNSVRKLRKRFENETSMRSDAFWAECALMEMLAPLDDVSESLDRVIYGSLVNRLTEVDRPWLEAGLADNSRSDRRRIALQALIRLWFERGRIASELDDLRELIQSDINLLQFLLAQTSSQPSDNELQRQIAESERERQCRERAHAAEKETRLKQWQKWHEWLIGNIDKAFSVEKVHETLSIIHLWLRKYKQDTTRFNNWDKELLKQAFGPDVADHVEKAFQKFWRKKSPILWSALPPEERNRTPQDQIMGLVGVSAEASHSEWAKNLTSQDARLAAAYATIEINGLAPFIADLAETHPSEVEAVIGGELSAELLIGSECEHLPILQNLGHTDSKLKSLLVPRLLEELRSRRSVFSTEVASKWCRHLECMLRVLTEAEHSEDREAISRECLERLHFEPDGPLAIMWLRGLFQLNPQCATKALISTLGDGSDADTSARAVKIFAALFGGLDPVMPEISDPTEYARVLGELVRCAYAFVRRKEDLIHTGAYTPGIRDDAQTARNFLLSKLLETPGPEAYRVVLELACEKDFEHISDRLRLLARKKAAAEGEFPPFNPTDIVTLEDSLEAPVRDAQGLFSLMISRLKDLDHDLRYHEFSDRKTVKGITEESEMRHTLAMRLHDKANDAYKVAQEEEVANRKRTDIRLLAVGCNHKAVIEIKIADKNRSLRDLESALEKQLVGQYLQHNNCRSGCLLLTYAGKRKGWRHPESRKPLSPRQAVEYLQVKARKIEAENQHQVHLDVYLLDLSDPIPDAAASH